MNGKTTQSAATQLSAAEFDQQWQEAKRCNSKKPCEPKPQPEPRPEPRPEPCPVICERDSEEINIYVNTEHQSREAHHRSGVWAWLPWLLLGLTSLLLLGNLFTMFALAQTNNNRAREVSNTVNRSREVVRVERSDREVGYHETPRARW